MKLVRFSKLFDLRLIVCSIACLAGTFANAQISQGSFNLPREARWGIAVLPPGPYSFTLDHAVPGGIVLVRARGSAVMVPVTGQVRPSKESADSHLLVVTEGGQTNIRELYLGGLGVTLGFHAPKPKYPIVAHTPTLKQTVLVAEARK